MDDLEDYIEEASSAEKERYRFLLEAALGGGVVQPADKEKLELYREMHAIPLEEHNALLFEMGWKEGEFEVGFHKDIAANHFQQYAALVKNELAKGEVCWCGCSKRRYWQRGQPRLSRQHLFVSHADLDRPCFTFKPLCPRADLSGFGSFAASGYVGACRTNCTQQPLLWFGLQE